MRTPDPILKPRTRFALFPVRRWVKDEGRYFKREGWYWLRNVVEVQAGLLKEWTAYAHYNEDQKG